MTKEQIEGMGLNVIELGGDELKAAQEKAELISQSCHFNEAVDVINKLLVEVESMPIASRFSKDRTVWESEGGTPAGFDPRYAEMSEHDFKRQQLRIDLAAIRQDIISKAAALKIVVMDMEATKLD